MRILRRLRPRLCHLIPRDRSIGTRQIADTVLETVKTVESLTVSTMKLHHDLLAQFQSS